MIVDFHCHSTASDGSFTPTELAQKGASFAAMAITDHDNCDGAEEFLASGGGCRRFAGIELSIEPGEGFDRFHLLGLGIDPGNAGLKAFLQRILDGRNARNERILANFRRLASRWPNLLNPHNPHNPHNLLNLLNLLNPLNPHNLLNLLNPLNLATSSPTPTARCWRGRISRGGLSPMAWRGTFPTPLSDTSSPTRRRRRAATRNGGIRRRRMRSPSSMPPEESA